VSRVREEDGHRVSSFANFVMEVAHLSFFNPGYEMMYRGQGADYRNSAPSLQTSLLPSIYRTGGYFTRSLAEERFDRLERAELQVCERARFKGKTRITPYRVLQCLCWIVGFLGIYRE
jgi:hypothetical protein